MKDKNKNIKKLVNMCLMKGDADELKAIIGLDFNIDWLDNKSPPSLLESALNISDESNLEMVIDYVIKKQEIDGWVDIGDKPLASSLINSNHLNIADKILKINAGNELNWDSLLSNISRDTFLVSRWNEVKNIINNHAPQKHKKIFEKNFDKYEWLSSANEVLLEDIKSSWSGKDCSDWFGEMMLRPQVGITDTVNHPPIWMISVLMDKINFKNISLENKWDVINNQNPGYLLYSIPVALQKSHSNIESTFKEFTKNIFKNIKPHEREVGAIDFMKKEMQEAVIVRKHIPLTVDIYSRKISNLKRVKAWGKFLDAWSFDLIKHNKDNNKSIDLIVLSSAIQSYLISPSSSSFNAIAQLNKQKQKNNFYTLDELLSHSIKLLNPKNDAMISSSINKNFLPSLSMDLLSSYEDNKKMAREVISSLEDNLLIFFKDDKDTQNLISKKICDFALKEVGKSQNKEIWSELFWRNIFNCSSIDRSNIFKKISTSGFYDVIKKIDYWDENPEFAEKIKKSADNKNRNRQTKTVVSKMVLLNDISVSKKSTPKKIKKI